MGIFWSTPSSYAEYSLQNQTFTLSGGGQASPSYAQRATLGEILAPSASGAISTHIRLRSGQLGLTVEPQTLTLGFADGLPATEHTEHTARPLRARVQLDDATTLYPPVADLRWQVLDGPLTPPDAFGLLHATATPANASATLRGAYRDLAAILPLTVLDLVRSYADWQANYFSENEIANDPRTLPEADFSGDATPNLLKYALGLPPREASATGLPAAGVSGGRLSLTFTRQPRPDLEYRVEASGDLSTWMPLWVAPGVITAPTSVTISDELPTTENRPRFLRLRVTFTSP